MCIRDRYFNVGSCSCFNLSIYVNFFNDIINVVALFCTFSIISMSPFLYGHQTEFAYSKCGLTMALYSKTKELISKCIKFLLMIPKIPYALLTFSFMWSKKASFESNLTPRLATDGYFGLIVANHHDGGESSVVVTTLKMTNVWFMIYIHFGPPSLWSTVTFERPSDRGPNSEGLNWLSYIGTLPIYPSKNWSGCPLYIQIHYSGYRTLNSQSHCKQPCLKHAGTVQQAETPGQLRCCTKWDRRPGSYYHTYFL